MPDGHRYGRHYQGRGRKYESGKFGNQSISLRPHIEAGVRKSDEYKGRERRDFNGYG
jgi:hypothetical protein